MRAGPPVVFFDRGEDRVSEQAQAILDFLAEPFLRYPVKTKIFVTGHADSAGPSAANMALSRRRAANVRKYLISRGIPASRLVAEAKGETEPYPGEAEEKFNRRVTVLEQISDAEHARRAAAYRDRGNIQC